MVGTIVLLALALIILPQLFDGEGSYQPQVQSRIPERPIITLLPEPQQVRPVMVADSQSPSVGAEAESVELTEQALNGNESEPAGVNSVASVTSLSTDTDSRPTLNAVGLPDGWVVQLGTFGDLDNASKLLTDLLAKGYKAYERRALRDEREISTILVGPVIVRAEAERLLAELATALDLKPLIKRYEREVLR
ncbi:MAG: SPOR domain-containing protein [Proteobacteria bacterium]|nr:SPOR domain-containing protein [Pseudomonadota bacterium]MDA1244671.1 SPOR domain-containing protein [Pseudomonadota bacterium]